VSIAQLICLEHLVNSQDNKSNHKELMSLLSLNSSTITGIVNRLVKRGLVTRLPKEEDKRVTRIMLTAPGMKLLEKTPNLLHDRLATRLGTLADDQKSGIKESLDLIIAAMDIKDVASSAVITGEEPE
jgi:DNA-binding MarR family transcriptional regulator